jgi:cardiolipin synthase
VRLFTRGDAAFAAMGDAIDAAKSEVLVESYILKDDATGVRFAERLEAAAERGVSVKVLADFIGSWATRSRFWARMRRRGVEARLFNPLSRSSGFNPSATTARSSSSIGGSLSPAG